MCCVSTLSALALLSCLCCQCVDISCQHDHHHLLLHPTFKTAGAEECPSRSQWTCAYACGEREIRARSWRLRHEVWGPLQRIHMERNQSIEGLEYVKRTKEREFRDTGLVYTLYLISVCMCLWFLCHARISCATATHPKPKTLQMSADTAVGHLSHTWSAV